MKEGSFVVQFSVFAVKPKNNAALKTPFCDLFKLIYPICKVNHK